MKTWIAGVLGLVLAGVACSSNVDTADGEDADDGNGGDGGTGGTAVQGNPCFDAAPPGFSFIGDGSCKSWQTGVVCQWVFADTATNEGGRVTCVGGEWTPISCPLIDTSFACPEEGVLLHSCDPLWLDNQCPWYVADAGFSCGGFARCTEDGWVSNGVDFSGEGP